VPFGPRNARVKYIMNTITTLEDKGIKENKENLKIPSKEFDKAYAKGKLVYKRELLMKKARVIKLYRRKLRRYALEKFKLGKLKRESRSLFKTVKLPKKKERKLIAIGKFRKIEKNKNILKNNQLSPILFDLRERIYGIWKHDFNEKLKKKFERKREKKRKKKVKVG